MTTVAHIRTLRKLGFNRLSIGIQVAQGVEQQSVDVVVLCAVFDEAIHQLGQVEAAGHVPEVVAQVQEILATLGLGNDIEVAAQR